MAPWPAARDHVTSDGVAESTGTATVPRASTASGPSGPSAAAVSSASVEPSTE